MLTAKNKKLGLTILGLLGGVVLVAAFFRAQAMVKANPQLKLTDVLLAQLKAVTQFNS